MENINIHYSSGDDIRMSKGSFTKMCFLFNAVQNGWTVSKRRDNYVFTRKINGKKEVFTEDYLKQFIKSNIDICNFNCIN